MTKPSAQKSRRTAKRRSDGVVRAGWKLVRSRGISVLRANALERQKWLIHGFSTRQGGVSRLEGMGVLNLGNTDWDTPRNVEKNRALLFAALGAAKGQMAGLRQCHTDISHVVTAPPTEALQGDALLTATPGLLLVIKTADCVPILLADKRRRAVAAVHAGWRGTLARIAEKTVGRMQMEFGSEPRDVVAALGPAIGRCCYEVGPEVAQAFAAQFDVAREWFDGPFEKVISDDSPNPLKWLQMTPPCHDPPPPRVYLDLHAANRWQLERAGVAPANIFASDLCTACRTDLLFSHRREQGKTGRMMAVIGVRAAVRSGG
jgi:YfiH family protein